MPHRKNYKAMGYDRGVGSRAQVWHGTAHHTSGGLTKKDLKKNNKTGRIVSRKVSSAAKKMYKRNNLTPASKSEMARLRRMARRRR